jgi:putative PIN family toxin of toxin-antitoxin system
MRSPPLHPLRLVLDTNVVLDLLYWRDPTVRPLDAALRRGEAVAVTDEACLAELRDVLGRPAFAGEDCDAAALVAAYAGACRRIAADPTAAAGLPACRDPDDQKFLELARAAGADLLVTRDKALLALGRRKFGIADFRILTPAQAMAWLADG